MKLLTRLLGGRPMTLIGPMFIDTVTGNQVNFYRDKFGNPWMAESRWSLFRVRATHEYEIWSKP